ncbi:hypothetical protein RJ45_11570 [Photobacterium gaetbulicola]|uniref:HTH araC/xylS-type domain-containing protein n=1 Tax=Photobacterium gaetbulicola TaxID=1295392 RepID=A0A0B9GXH3_9GAMM|nr:helix-turn-helix transcriptional regulator [Photobacterium gaetbulicola]KHT63451.1 hypothetical protein RJ45_11570 [Photobacterium gaetbulicola]
MKVNLVNPDIIRSLLQQLSLAPSELNQVMGTTRAPYSLMGLDNNQFLSEKIIYDLLTIWKTKFQGPKLYQEVVTLVRNFYVPNILNQLPKDITILAALHWHNSKVNAISTNTHVELAKSTNHTFTWKRQKIDPQHSSFGLGEQLIAIYMTEVVAALAGHYVAPLAVTLTTSEAELIATHLKNSPTQLFVCNRQFSMTIAEALLYEKHRYSVTHTPRLSAIPMELKAGRFDQQIKHLVKPYIQFGIPPQRFIADLCGISTRQLQRELQKENKQFRAICLDVLIEAVQSELLNSERTISAIAFDYGYSSPSHFCRSFRKVTGYSPGEYRLLYNTQNK